MPETYRFRVHRSWRKSKPAISGVIDEIVAALTRPLTAEEEVSQSPKESEKPARIIFKGNLEEVNRFFYKRGWTDGLPIIPPTEEAVAEMLTGTDLPPDHLVAKLEPRLGKATVEKIAINAVMAGALPTYMPLLIAGVPEPWLTNRGSGYDGGQHRLLVAVLDYQRPHTQRHSTSTPATAP